jgi:hypothetical protein
MMCLDFVTLTLRSRPSICNIHVLKLSTHMLNSRHDAACRGCRARGAQNAAAYWKRPRPNGKSRRTKTSQLARARCAPDMTASMHFGAASQAADPVKAPCTAAHAPADDRNAPCAMRSTTYASNRKPRSMKNAVLAA